MINHKDSLIHFILNEKEIATDLPPGMVLLDFIRYHQHLTGTKIGCREGDCGACTVLVGEIMRRDAKYCIYTIHDQLPDAHWQCTGKTYCNN